MKVVKWSATKYRVEQEKVGTVFIGTKEQCDAYIADRGSKANFAYDTRNITKDADFQSYQR